MSPGLQTIGFLPAFPLNAINMTLWNSVLYVLYNAALPPFVFTVCLILVLASWGKTLGVRKLYVEMLLMIFEVRRECQLSN